MNTLKTRLSELEAKCPEDYPVQGVTIYCEPKQKGAIPLPIEAFRIDYAGTSTTIKRKRTESQSQFIKRATAIRDSFCEKTKGKFVPPSPIMWHLVDHEKTEQPSK